SARTDLPAAIDKARAERHFPNVVVWALLDERRVVVVPSGHWLLLAAPSTFLATLTPAQGAQHAESIQVGQVHVACFAPGQPAGDSKLHLERYAKEQPRARGVVRFLAPEPSLAALEKKKLDETGTTSIANAGRVGQPSRLTPDDTPLPLEWVLLTNGIGVMARMAVY